MDIRDRLALWFADVTLRPASVARYRVSFNQLERAGITQVEDLTRAKIRRWVTDRRAVGRTMQTCKRDVAAVRSLLRWLEERDDVTLEQVRELERMRLKCAPRPPVRFLTREQYRLLLEAAGDVHELAEIAIALGVNSGLRLAELVPLRREDLELDLESAAPAPFVWVRRERHETKTGKPRTAAMDVYFARWLASRPALAIEGPLFPANGLVGRGPRSGRECVGRATLQRWLVEARELAGLPWVTWLVLRHTYGTWLAMANKSSKIIADNLGNSARMAEEHYLGSQPGGRPDFAGIFRIDDEDDHAAPAAIAA